MMHHNECPQDSYGATSACRCLDPDFYLGRECTAEDVYHLDEMILSEKSRSGGLLALPGLEWVRNMIAARVGEPVRPLGWDLRDEENAA